MRAQTPQLPSLSSPPSRGAGSPPRHPRPAPGTATAPRASDAEPGTGSPGPGSCQAGEGQRPLWTFRDSPSPQSLSLPSARRKRKSLRGWSSSPGGRPTPVGTPAAPTGEVAAPAPEAAAAVPRSWPRQPLPRSVRSCPSCGRLSACGTHSLCRDSRGPLLSPPLQVSSAQRFLAREILFLKKERKKKMTPPPTSPSSPPHPSAPSILPFHSPLPATASARGPPSLAGLAQWEEAEVIGSCPAWDFAFWGEELREEVE